METKVKALSSKSELVDKQEVRRLEKTRDDAVQVRKERRFFSQFFWRFFFLAKLLQKNFKVNFFLTLFTASGSKIKNFSFSLSYCC